MEFIALCVAWCTFWGGLMFYLVPGEETAKVTARVVMTVAIVGSNIIFLVNSSWAFGREFIKDVKKKSAAKRETKRLSRLALGLPMNSVSTEEAAAAPAEAEEEEEEQEINNTHIVPVNSTRRTELVEKNDSEEDDDRFTPEISRQIRRASLTHTRSTVVKAHALHDEFYTHELALQAKNDKLQKKQRRKTQNRVIARLKIRKTKALSKVPMFKKIHSDVIESILECTTYEKHKAGDILCTQGDVATDFYIIVTGKCDVQVTGTNKNGDTQLPRKVGSLKDLDYFGESALLEGVKTRNATVIAESEYVQVLLLSRMNFELLVEGGLLTADILSTVTKESKRREELTRKSFEIVDETETLEEEDCWDI